MLDAPVVNVSWSDAVAFCAWDGGKRLPAEAEWEWAARGGRENARYPWGDDPPVDEAGNEHGARFGVETWEGGAALKPVGSYSLNGYGLHDMAGSVWEWTADRYRADWYLVREGETAKGPEDGECCVVRGGAWASKDASHLRVANRLFIGDARPSEALRSVGFRCAADPE
jgi:formylglycine-generating enzyme required for sulfatase activity